MMRMPLLKTAAIAVGFVTSMSVCHADLGVLSDDAWDNTAVRKVLHIFAYGGFATDAQVQAWADMAPQAAIAEMLTFAPTNDLLSPPEDDNLQAHLLAGGADRSLQVLQDFWWSDLSSDNHYLDVVDYYSGTTPVLMKPQFSPLNTDGSQLNSRGLKNTWMLAVNKRGLNPFRQRVGYWLTNYLMSAHVDAMGRAGNFIPVRTQYDESMDLLAQGHDFATVLGDGAASAAMALQYGHRNSRYYATTGKFAVNDDFAREFHQLFFGIHGVLEGYPEDSPEATAFKAYYEDTTIEGTAQALTGMAIVNGRPYGVTSDFPVDQIDFQSSTNVLYHFGGAVEALNYAAPGTPNVSGATAEAKLANLAQLAIHDPESEANLPVVIASYFADDNLDPQTKSALRSGWLAAGKNLLAFLRAYAISPEFHRAERVKYMNAVERNMRIFNQNTVDNTESYLNHRAPYSQIEAQDAMLFYPKHFVFGGQTGIEAADNSQVFKAAYNANVQNAWFLGITYRSEAVPTGTPLPPPYWVKDWAKLIPKSADGTYRVGDVARWLWNHFVGDGGKNYGIQERAYCTALLADGNDFLSQISAANPVLEGYTDEGLQTDPVLVAKIAANEAVALPLDSTAPSSNPANPAGTQRDWANQRVGRAVNFITATPFMFAQEGL